MYHPFGCVLWISANKDIDLSQRAEIEQTFEYNQWINITTD